MVSDGTGNSFEFSGGGASARVLRVRQTDAVGNFSGDGTLNVVTERDVATTVKTTTYAYNNDHIQKKVLGTKFGGENKVGLTIQQLMKMEAKL